MSSRARLGLTAKVTALFGAGAALLSVSLAVVTFSLTRSNSLQEHESGAVRVLRFDAAVVRQALGQPDADVLTALRSLDTGRNRRPLVFRDGLWYARSASDDALVRSIPPALVAAVESGQAAAQRVSLRGEPVLVLGAPLPSADAALFEVDDLAEVSTTLTDLGRTLTAVAVSTTVAGALLGWWAARRLLRPLQQLATTTERIAEGDLSARLTPSRDADLAPIAASFNAMVREVSNRLERDRRFAADISHELRSPLQTLIAASGVLRARTASFDERSARAVDLVATEVDRFSALVEDLIELAKADQPVALQDTDVDSLLRSACRSAGVSADLVAVPAGLTWRLDPRRVEQAVVNLLVNASTHGGGAEALRAWTEQGRLVVEVDDRGPGVPLAERDLVFGRFARGRSASTRGDAGGSGLGLSLVAEHAAAHGGSASVGDRPGGGARFRVTIPTGAGA